MQLGRLNRRVTIQSKSVTRDAYGAEVITWAHVVEVWAAVLPVRGREYVALREAQADLTTRFVIRYRAGITPAMRVVYGDANYDIEEVIDAEDAHHVLELMARAEAPAS